MELTDSSGRPRRTAELVSRLVFFGLPVAYALTFARYWLADIDEGFLLGLGWRVIHGLVPHRDFIYVRPAVPILTQALQLLVLPENLQLIGSRISFYGCLATYSWASSDLLMRAFGARAAGIDRWLLAAAAFVFSAHDFPPMVWHTTDGILFLTLGLALLFGAKRQLAIAAGCLCLVLGALCKQPYYLVALVGPLYAGALNGRRAGVSAAAWTAAWVALTAGVLAAFGALSPFWVQTTRSLGTGGGMFDSGVFQYLDASFMPVLVAVAFGWLASRVASHFGRELDPGLSVAVGVLALFGVALAREASSTAQRFAEIDAHYDPHVLVWLGAALVATEIGRLRREMIALGALLLVAWTSGITRGSQGPGLFAAPLLFSLLYFTASHLRSRHLRGLQWLLIAGGVTTFSLMYFAWPRGDEPGPHYPTADLGAVSPKLSFVRGSPYTQRKYRELLEARARYGERLTVLPGLALAHFVLDLQNPLPVDLVGNPELAGGEAWFFRALDEDVDYVLIERIHPRDDMHDTVARVRGSWTKVETLETFEVWRSPRLAAPEVGDALDHPEAGQRADRVGGE